MLLLFARESSNSVLFFFLSDTTLGLLPLVMFLYFILAESWGIGVAAWYPINVSRLLFKIRKMTVMPCVLSCSIPCQFPRSGFWAFNLCSKFICCCCRCIKQVCPCSSYSDDRHSWGSWNRGNAGFGRGWGRGLCDNIYGNNGPPVSLL